ncbi:MAG TPA: peptidoglycan DD-metalloendopeptidase family protein [Rhizomicrobium sp.]|nr:peptidoglycan DD-metalloendopeptidase family protein [Rhizomicrobium sp.]
MRRAALLLLCAPFLLGAAKQGDPHCGVSTKPCAGKVVLHPPKPHHAIKHAKKPVPTTTASAPPAPPLNDNTDTSHAIPAGQALKLPSTKDQFETLRNEIKHDRPAMLDARQKSDTLKAQAAALQKKLIDTAARVVALEDEKQHLDADIARLTDEDQRLSASFARDRVSVARLLAILERMQHDMPPAIVLRPDDALGAARSAMLIGASVPNVYGEAAALARRIKLLQQTRIALVTKRAQGQRNAVSLKASRDELDQLLATKELEADAAAQRYGDLASKLEQAATTAADLEALLEKVSALRTRPAQDAIVTVSAQKPGTGGPLQGRSLLVPVAGRQVPGGMDGVGGARAPGLTFATAAGARVIAPADSEVIFAGPYHKTGQVLILELTAGYDLVLAGLGRADVRPNDEVLAGEPVGIMPNSGQNGLLYFELRQNGHGISPAPWLAVELRKAQK